MEENNESSYEQKILELEKKLELSRSEEERLKNLFDNVQDVFYQVSLDGIILEISPSIVFFSEFKREKLIGKDVRLLYANPVDRENLLCELKKSCRVDDYELQIKGIDGASKYVSVNARLLGDIKQREEFINGSLRDITQRKRIEQEILKKNEKLNILLKEKDKFFSIISHDLISPFNVFLGFTELLKEDAESMSTEQIVNMANVLYKSAWDMFSLLENLLQLSRIQNSKVKVHKQGVASLHEIKKIIETMAEVINKKGIIVEYNIPFHVLINADPHLFEVVIRNLVSNAIKFTPKGGKITVSVDHLPTMSVVSIKDTGVGMNQEVLDSLFGSNVKTRKGTDGEPTSGLGLEICKDFIERHGGKMTVESEEGKGSIFSFTLPNN